MFLRFSPRNCVLLPHGSMINEWLEKQFKILLGELCEESIGIAVAAALSFYSMILIGNKMAQK